MRRVDARGCEVSGASTDALDAFERALAACLAWRRGADGHLARALRAAPRFVMAHVLQAWMLLAGRDPQRARAAAPLLRRARTLPANERERLHLAAIDAALRDDYESSKALLGEALRRHPRDVVALQAVHGFDYVTGDADRMRDRVASVLPAWSRELAGHHAVLAMHAFSLEECGEYARAEAAACAAIELHALDARAHHVMAHVFEMTRQADAGAQWMAQRMPCWGTDTVVATHAWWHLALFHLALDRPGRALALYDERVRAGRSAELSDLIDAASLLWRLRLKGVDVESRAAELAEAWAPHVQDAFCSFSDLHAMLAFVAANDWERAGQLDRVLAQAQLRPTRHGESTRLVGLPACRAMVAFGKGAFRRAAGLFSGLPAFAHRIGGSHAQRDVLTLTQARAAKGRRAMPAGAPQVV